MIRILPDIPNNPEIFGDQVQIDENENIIYEEKKLLINAISKGIKEVEIFVHSLNGIFIPAHIDRRKNSIYSQLGFLPEDHEGRCTGDFKSFGRLNSSDRSIQKLTGTFDKML